MSKFVKLYEIVIKLYNSYDLLHNSWR